MYIKTQFKIFSYVLAMFLLNGMLFSSLYAEASFFSNLLSADASADTNLPGNPQNDLNSQNMVLLQANVSTNSVVEEKTTPNQISEDVSINIVSDNALMPVTGPMGVSDGTDAGSSFEEVSIYVVRKGDSIAQIAEMFEVSSDTILWANDMKKGDKLVEGDILFILPVSGVEHIVKKGETLKGIASLYKADISEIARFNGIIETAPIISGDKLIIPNAQKSDTGTVVKSSSIAKKTTSKPAYDTKTALSGYFINPVPGARKSQGIHDKYAVDLAIATGTPIRASASGTVTFARMGYNGGFGGLVIIQHPNGVQTYYAHQSKISVVAGQKVSQGQTIGYVGSTGRSTGPHVHFEVRGAYNPGWNNSWASY